ncbi:MAG: hypothetical protein KF708_18970 [Pirellulales bacterium]|nr:hypothetical protein [Pirellulales bacterium]
MAMNHCRKTRKFSWFAIAFWFTVMGMLFWTLYDGDWEAVLLADNVRWIKSLDSRPAWSTPIAPTYEEFQYAFREQPGELPITAPIKARLRWDRMLMEFLLRLWGVVVVFALLSVSNLSEQRSLASCLARSCAVTFTVAAALCLVLSVVLNGWGLAFPHVFAIVGLLLGLLHGEATWKRRQVS